LNEGNGSDRPATEKSVAAEQNCQTKDYRGQRWPSALALAQTAAQAVINTA